jgi:hypothetical protein
MRMRRPTRGPDPGSFRTVRYDLLKELTVALGIIGILVFILGAALSSPDVKPDTIQRWSQGDPVDFLTTASDELAAASVSAQYGPPYNVGSGSTQTLGPFQPEVWAGVHQNVDPVNQFILAPLHKAAALDPVLTSSLSTFDGAGSAQQGTWLTAYSAAIGNATVNGSGVSLPKGDYGPVEPMMNSLLVVANSGGLDGLLLSSSGDFYQTDYTAPLLFMGDGGHLAGLAQDQQLLGNQWGAMNETGRYPGQAWLWLFSMWYQVPPYNTAANADLLVVLTMGVLSVALLLVPFIPGLRDIPRWIPIHRLIWRRFYAEEASRR